MSTIASWLQSTHLRPWPRPGGVRLERVAELFVDTSAWYPVVVADHPDHAAVASVMEEALRNATRLVTTNLVVAETHALLLQMTNRALALAFARAAAEPSTVVVASSAELEHIALEEWLARYADQDFSLTDAVSFVVMKRRRIAQAITLDAHFAAAGFEAVPAKSAGRPRRHP